MADNIQATPRNYLGGLLSDAYKWMQSPERTQQMQGFAGLLGTTGVPQTIERMAYGEPLTNIGRANMPLLKPETADALMTVAPMVGPAARGAEAGLLSAGRAGERLAERVVPQVMERGGLPAQLLGDLSHGSRRQIFAPATQEEAFTASKLLKTKTPQEVWQETGIGKYGGEYVKEISDQGAKFNTAQDIASDAQKIRDRNLELKQTIKESQSTYPDLFPKELTAARRPLREEIKANQNILERNYGYESDPKWMGNFAQLAYEHPELYKEFPQLKNVVVRQGRDDPSFLGSYEKMPNQTVGSVDVTKSGLLKDPRSTATHEMQHAVSDISGWQAGGNPEMFQQQEAAKLTKDALSWNKEIENAKKRYPDENRAFLESVVVDDYAKAGAPDWIPSIEARDMARLFSKYPEQLDEAQNLVKVYGLDKKVTPNAPDKVYRNLEGEALARLAQTRIDLTPQERLQYFPFEQQTPANKYGMDVNPDDLIYRDAVNGLLGR
jgi:hypothetical protein